MKKKAKKDWFDKWVDAHNALDDEIKSYHKEVKKIWRKKNKK